MKHLLTLIAAVTLIGAAAISSACPFCKIRKTGLFNGPTEIMGDGTARAWINIGKDGKPIEIGFTLSKLALRNLPETGTEPDMGPEFTLKLPSQASITPFDHVGVDWNPKGHEPKGIYDKPHFDGHFYTIPTTTRSLITLEGDSKTKCVKAPPKGYMPEGYIMAPGTDIKWMGVHWADLKSPEFAGKPFTSTLIYGSYDAKLAFIEPMFTVAMLESKPDFHGRVPTPKLVEKSGYYPTSYRISWDEKREEYTVAMGDFVLLAGPGKPAPVAKTKSK